MGSNERCGDGCLSSDCSGESPPRTFCRVVAALINHAIVVIVDSIGRNPRALQKSPSADRRGSTPKAGAGERPCVGEGLESVKISDLIFRGGGGGLVAVGAVEVETKHSSGQIVIGNI